MGVQVGIYLPVSREGEELQQAVGETFTHLSSPLFNKHMEDLRRGRQGTGAFPMLVPTEKYLIALKNQPFFCSAVSQLRNVYTRHLHLLPRPHSLVCPYHWGEPQGWDGSHHKLGLGDFEHRRG